MMPPAAAIEASTAVAALFSSDGQPYPALNSQATRFHQQYVQALNFGGQSYACTGTANASLLQGANSAAGAPTLLFGRPLIGNGANGAPGNAFE